MRKNEPGKLGDILRARLLEKNLSRQADSAFVCAQAQKHLPNDVQAKSFKGGILKVLAPNQSRATILSLQAVNFGKLINESLRGEVIKKIIFRVSEDLNS